MHQQQQRLLEQQEHITEESTKLVISGISLLNWWDKYTAENLIEKLFLGPLSDTLHTH